MQNIVSRFKAAADTTREQFTTWWNAEPTDGECDCSLIGNNGRGCRKRDCLARTVLPSTQARRMRKVQVDETEPVSVRRFNRLISTGKL